MPSSLPWYTRLWAMWRTYRCYRACSYRVQDAAYYAWVTTRYG